MYASLHFLYHRSVLMEYYKCHKKCLITAVSTVTVENGGLDVYFVFYVLDV